MKNIIIIVSCIYFFGTMQACVSKKATTNANTEYIIVTDQDPLNIYIKNYFILSEQRDIETWYNTYLNKCKQFYKIENPSKDSIVNIIKSYWVTSNQQKHTITKIESKKLPTGKEIFVTMDYSYTIIATNTAKLIQKLKLQIIVDDDNKVWLIKEFSRGI